MKEEGYDTKTTLIIISVIIVLSLLGFVDLLPDNCHRTPSVDVGGGEIECD